MPRIRRRGFLPATGTLHHLKFPDRRLTRRALRVETGVRAGDAISPFYDPMIAKLVVHGADRTTALAALARCAGGDRDRRLDDQSRLPRRRWPRDPDFAAGDVDTGLIARKQDALTAAPAPDDRIVALAVLAAARSSERGPAVPDDPWSSLSGYAHFHPLARQVTLAHGEDRDRGRRYRSRRTGASTSCSTGASSRRRIDLAEPVRTALWPGHVTVFAAAQSLQFRRPRSVRSAPRKRRAQPTRCGRRCRAWSRSSGRQGRRRHQGTAAADPRSHEDGAHDRRAA